MPFNHNNEYEPSKKFERDLKKWLSKYLYSDMNGCTEKEYEKIFDLLSEIEINFYNRDYVSNNNPNLTFEEKRDNHIEDMKQYAISKILKKLNKLKEKRNKYYSNEENHGWIKCKTDVYEVAKMIWKIWSHERKHHPRAGTILCYYDELDAVEISLINYKKNNSIQLGYAKGKIEFGENFFNGAAREAAEELGLDAKWIYDQIKNSLPIKKNVFYTDIKTSIEHYYFIIPIRTKIRLMPNEKEIQGVEWHNAYTIPCCNNCQIKQSIQSAVSSRESNYFMVNCNDRDKCNSLVLDTLMYIDEINENQIASQEYKTIHRLCPHN